MNYYHRITSFLNYYLSAQTTYRVHSPFVFDFIENVIIDHKVNHEFQDIERIRMDLLKNQSEFVREDFGAGSSVNKNNSTTVANLAKNSLAQPHDGRMFYRFVKHYGFESILELGTSLGVSCLYMAAACPEGQVTTIEGDPKVYDLAKDNGRKAGLNNINYINNEFDTFLNDPDSLKKPFDLILMDGNHSYEPTVRYFNLLWSFVRNQGAIIIDDIHWSKGMTKAWHEIKEHNKDAFCFETWRFGIVFKGVNAANGPNVKWIPSYLKPWKAGIFK